MPCGYVIHSRTGTTCLFFRNGFAYRIGVGVYVARLTEYGDATCRESGTSNNKAPALFICIVGKRSLPTTKNHYNMHPGKTLRKTSDTTSIFSPAWCCNK